MEGTAPNSDLSPCRCKPLLFPPFHPTPDPILTFTLPPFADRGQRDAHPYAREWGLRAALGPRAGLRHKVKNWGDN
eukprot:1271189-Pyramimonas_sp.AAC.1